MLRSKNIFIVVLCFILVIGCAESKPKIPDPSSVALSYVKATTSSNFELVYDLLSSEDTNYISKNDYLEFKVPLDSYLYELDAATLAIREAISGQAQYTVKDKTINEAFANVVVTVSAPDYSFIIEKIFTQAFSSAFNLENDDDTNSILQELVDSGEIPRNITEEFIELKLEDNEWKIVENVEEAYEKYQLDKKIDKLLTKAADLKKKKKYVESINNYKEVLSIDESNAKAQSSINIIEKELAEQAIKQDYINNIEIFEFEAKRIDTYLNKNIPAVRFAIKNNGNRSLDKVEITVYFYDWDDNPIFEETYLPVLVSEYSYSNNDPLKPNYIRRQKSGKYYTIDQLGPEWSGKANAIVSDIRFSED